MRILFTFAGGNGHFQPLVPIAKNAQQKGHHVLFAGQKAMESMITAAGFLASVTSGETLSTSPKRRPLLPLDSEREDRDLRDGFATRLTRQRASALISLCNDWKPDVVVCDEVDFGAMIAADYLNIPYASVLVIASGSFIRTEVVGDALNKMRAEFGLSPDPDLQMLHRNLVLSPFPPSFRHPNFPLPFTAHSFNNQDHSHIESEFFQWRTDSDLPIVYFTLGTIFNLESGDLFEKVLLGLKDLPINVIATVGNEIDRNEFGQLPQNIQVEQYILQELILPNCTLVISHGGSGSVLGAMSYGKPMVLIPMGADQPHNASRSEALEIAKVLDPIKSEPNDIKSAVMEVLTTTQYRINAESLQDEIMNLPDTKSALQLIEQLATKNNKISHLPA